MVNIEITTLNGRTILVDVFLSRRTRCESWRWCHRGIRCWRQAVLSIAGTVEEGNFLCECLASEPGIKRHSRWRLHGYRSYRLIHISSTSAALVTLRRFDITRATRWIPPRISDRILECTILNRDTIFHHVPPFMGKSLWADVYEAVKIHRFPIIS